MPGSTAAPGPATFWRGIRGRLLRSYLLLMLLVAGALAVATLSGLEAYYRNAMADVLRTRGAAGQQYFSRLEPGVDITLAGQDLARELGAAAPYRVQVYGSDGRLVGDSTLPASPRSAAGLATAGSGGANQGGTGAGPAPGGIPMPADVSNVLQTRSAAETTDRSSGGNRALHLAIPLLLADRQVAGALRFSTSLAVLDQMLWRVGLVLLLVTLALLALTAGVGLLLARTVIQPVAELTRVAEAVAGGNLGLRARVYFPDEVGRLAETLNRMAAGLGEVDRLRHEFLRAVSHDLRTPLTAIKAWSVTLQDTDLGPEDLRAGLAAIEDSTDHLARLVEDLLMAARLQAGAEVTLQPQRVDAGRTVAAVCRALLPRARAAGVTLEWPDAPQAAPQLPPVWFDPDRLTQVAANLVENALKFTPRGGLVRVELQPAPSGEAAPGAAAAAASPAVLIIVTDNGLGIDPADLRRLTAPFFRGRTAAGIPGTGLGLAIVAAILQRSGGKLRIDSELGRGTKATAILPLDGREAS